MKTYFKRPGKWLIALGLILTVVSMVFLSFTPDMAQYIAPAGDMSEALETWKTAEAGDAALAYVKYGETLYYGDGSVDCALWYAGRNWFFASQTLLTGGRYFSDAEHETGGHALILDSGAAFTLFRDEDCLGKTVLLGEAEYTVVGVVREKDMVGDTAKFDAFIPLSTAVADEMTADYGCVFGSESAAGALESAAQGALGEGGFFKLSKEVMRATMLARVLFIVFAMYILLRALKYWIKKTRDSIRGWNEEVLKRYFRTMLPGVIAKSALLLLGYIAIFGACAGVLALIIRPMYVFTEWVPEVFVEWSSISKRVSELAATFSAPVKYQTRELASVRIWGAVLRWGALLLVSGTLLVKKWPERKK